MKRIIKTIVTVAATILATSAFATVTTLGEMADVGSSWIPSVGDLVAGVGYVGGVTFIVKCALALKDSNERRTGFYKPIVYFLCGACLIMLPSMMGVGVSSLFGSSGASSNSSSGNRY